MGFPGPWSQSVLLVPVVKSWRSRSGAEAVVGCRSRGVGRTQAPLSTCRPVHLLTHCSPWAPRQPSTRPGPRTLLESDHCCCSRDHPPPTQVREQSYSSVHPQGREFCRVCSLLNCQGLHRLAWYVPGVGQMCEPMGDTGQGR